MLCSLYFTGLQTGMLRLLCSHFYLQKPLTSAHDRQHLWASWFWWPTNVLQVRTSRFYKRTITKSRPTSPKTKLVSSRRCWRANNDAIFKYRSTFSSYRTISWNFKQGWRRLIDTYQRLKSLKVMYKNSEKDSCRDQKRLINYAEHPSNKWWCEERNCQQDEQRLSHGW